MRFVQVLPIILALRSSPRESQAAVSPLEPFPQGAIGVRVVSVAGLILGLTSLLIAGCRPASQTPTAAEGASAQQQQQMQEMLDYLKQNNATFEEMKQQLQQLRAQQEDPSGVRALGEDLQVAKALVGAARRAAGEKRVAETGAALERLIPALIALRATLPAARVAEAVERAAAALNSYQAADAVKIASRNLMQAKDICLSAPATLSPNVLKELESAKAQVDKQNVSGGNEALLGLLKTLQEDESVRTAAQALAAGRGAQEALGLGAWVVVLAQMDYLDTLLAALAQKVEGAKTAVSGEQPPATAGGGEARPEAPAPTSAPPPAAGASGQPAAAPTPPAGTGASTGTGPAAAPAGGTQ